jgi:hypothetical protein
MPSTIIIGKVSQSEGDWVLKNLRICIREEDWAVQASVEYPKLARGVCGIQLATRKTVQSLAEAGTPDPSPTLIWKRVIS